jgi:hypothetical protein
MALKPGQRRKFLTTTAHLPWKVFRIALRQLTRPLSRAA